MSIKQNPRRAGRGRYEGTLPDFRNLGVVLRMLLLVNGLALVAVLIRNRELVVLGEEILDMALRVEFPLILSVAALFLLRTPLQRLPYRVGLVGTGAVVIGVVLGVQGLLAPLGYGGGGRPLLWSMVTAGCVMTYFHLRGAAQAPVLAEARLLALTARIRPHFLFNSLNGVLGVLRSNPRRAEEGLEELADLFRALMQDNRELVPLADEIVLCERYLNLERLRLGDRLKVAWQRDAAAEESLVPPLFLQPLVENAVYHGVEPGAGPGQVSISIARRGPEVVIEIANPVIDAEQHHAGNRMALDNIRERLMLFYDLEAALDTEQTDDAYRVRIRLPFRSER
ncbi:MAG: histidine kinase [Zoogloea sp.]|uniref:sensor histidine kinase n=1 Tax=Zoogloea sp. TaxID=49181 RepID=UPI0026117A0D|nr:histidine kinase [Zoogloea sp.]MDD2988494.1 histidine kinase [Zoogloea sp.]